MQVHFGPSDPRGKGEKGWAFPGVRVRARGKVSIPGKTGSLGMVGGGWKQ